MADIILLAVIGILVILMWLSLSELSQLYAKSSQYAYWQYTAPYVQPPPDPIHDLIKAYQYGIIPQEDLEKHLIELQYVHS